MNRQQFWKRFREDWHDCPATMALCASWLVLFAWMVLDDWARGGLKSPFQLLLGLSNGHWFGDLTLRELYAGQHWRALTATFVHYGLIHVGMNLFALYQLGGLVESWYGSGPFMAIYVLTGAVGNLLSALIRHQLHSNPMIESGGGSTVIMGLVSLCAVAGWQSRTRIGTHLRNQMIWVLALTGGIGFGLTFAGLPVIDNWGHFGGAVVGAVVGLADAPLLRRAGGRLGCVAGGTALAAIVACALTLIAADRAELTRRQLLTDMIRERRFPEEYMIQQLEKIRVTYRAVVFPHGLRRGQSMPMPRTNPKTTAKPIVIFDPGLEFDGEVLRAVVRLFGALTPDLERSECSADARRARQLLAQTLVEFPTFEEIREFDEHIRDIQNLLRRRRDARRARVVAEGR